ncbi:hypothetical protein D3C87_1937910 [compost metagenome]
MLQGLFEPGFRQLEFVVAGRQLFKTFQVGAQRIGLFYHQLFVFGVVMLIENRPEIVT